MFRCVFRCMSQQLGFVALAGLTAFIIALLATGGNAILAAEIAGVVLGTFALTVAANCFTNCRRERALRPQRSSPGAALPKSL